MKTILRSTLVMLAVTVYASTVTANDYELGADPERVELMIMPHDQDAEDNLIVRVMIRNVSRQVLRADEIWPILLEYELTWESPDGERRTATFGGWRGPKPIDLNPGETYSAHASARAGDQRRLPAVMPGIHLLWWQIGSNRSNTLCFMMHDGQLERLPHRYNEREWERQKERHKRMQNQASEAIGANAPQPQR